MADQAAAQPAGSPCGRVPAPPRQAAEHGLAAVELALALPFLITFLLASLDLAQAAARAFEAHSVARAAGAALQRLAILPPDLPGNTGGGANVLPPNSWPAPPAPEPAASIPLGDLVTLPPGVEGSTRLYWGCGPQAASLSGRVTCADGARAAPYAEVVVEASVGRLLAWPGVLLPGEVTARAIVRLG
jgi:hypothetical protein